jgi:hypothetical protein
MAKPNYAFEKRQRELAKKRKKEEKRLQKAGVGDAQSEDASTSSDTDDEAPKEGET